ncbi:MAG: DNA polymerase, partial [Ignavibacteria bacterium]|nr:DNA polymerase [Ignavibacteria bacterium]
HIPNLVIAQLTDGREFRFPPDNTPMTVDYDVTKNFCLWLFTEEHTGFTVIAHNFKGYDGQFILQHMVENNLNPRIIKNHH